MIEREHTKTKLCELTMIIDTSRNISKHYVLLIVNFVTIVLLPLVNFDVNFNITIQ